jgi:hypothetical protein
LLLVAGGLRDEVLKARSWLLVWWLWVGLVLAFGFVAGWVVWGVGFGFVVVSVKTVLAPRRPLVNRFLPTQRDLRRKWSQPCACIFIGFRPETGVFGLLKRFARRASKSGCLSVS